MKNRIKKRRPYVRRPLSAEAQAWLNIVPVGREFGSNDYERLARLDALADAAKASAERALASIDETLRVVAASNQRIELIEKLGEIHPGRILLREFIVPGGLTPEDVAASIDLPVDQMMKILQGAQPLTDTIAENLEQVFNMEADFWRNLQTEYDRRVPVIKPRR